MANATKASILTFASRAWQTTFTGDKLDAAISACLSDLDGSDLLIGSTYFDLDVDSRYFAKPDNYKSVVAIQLTGPDGTMHDPLAELPGGLRQWRFLKAATAPAGRPKYFFEWISNTSEGILIYPRSDVIYTVRMDFWRTHPQTPDSIVYPVQFQHLLNLGTVYWEAVFRRNTEYATHWGQLYYAQRQTHEAQTPHTVHGD